MLSTEGGARVFASAGSIGYVAEHMVGGSRGMGRYEGKVQRTAQAKVNAAVK
jgi:hypothetical protein